MNKISPVVITSRAAQKDIAKMRIHHADILRGINEQALKVQAYHQQKQIEADQKNAIKSEQDKQLREEKMTHEKTQQEFALKQKDLEVKAEKLKALNG